MLSIRLPLAIFIAVVLSIAAFFTQQSLASTTIGAFIPSIFVLLTFFFFLIPTLIASNGSTSTKPVSNSKPMKPTRNPSSNSNSSITTLYVGNLPYKANEISVKTLFEEIGAVTSVRLMKDRKTGRRKGFGFVEVDASKTDEYITKLNDSEFMDRTIKVRPAKDKA
jgi:RNA recognition motif-containing protein